MSIEEVFAEINKHEVDKFDSLDEKREEIKLAVEYLSSLGRQNMADHLKQMAAHGYVRLGPVDGFLAAAVVLASTDFIILSNKYPEYNSTSERVISLIHEIVFTTPFQGTEEDSEILQFGVFRWLEDRTKTKEPSKAKPNIVENNKSVVLSPNSMASPVIPKSPEPTTPPIKSTVSVQPVKHKARLTLIDTLISKGLVSRDQVNDAKDKQVGAKKPVHELLVEMGFLKEMDLLNTASEIFGTSITPLAQEKFDDAVLDRIPFELAQRHGIFPLRIEEGHLVLAMVNLQDILVFDDIRVFTDIPIKPILGSITEIKKFIQDYYGGDDRVYDILTSAQGEEDVELEEVNTDELLKGMEQEVQVVKDDRKQQQLPHQYKALLKEESPTVRLVNLLFGDAVRDRASDIHIEPREKIIEVRYRIDGDLKNIMSIPLKFHTQMVARIKILAQLDITKHVEPQDGRIQMAMSNKKIDFRVSTIPTLYGEKVVARILDASSAKTDLSTVGLDEDDMNKFIDAIKSPQGMVFVTGPTGSGKTSSLYAALNFIKGEKTNIVTVEDPVEFINEGINQVQVNPDRGITFASALRSILRQDPNVILLGEIRDKETAEIAVQASLTGHLVLSTLHTNSAVETITRLVDIGLEYYQIASSVVLIASQRLMKLICTECKEEYEPNENYKIKFKNEIEYIKLKKFYKGKGCPKCNFTGYFGRVAVFEILKFNQRLKDLVSAKSTPDKLRDEAKKTGMTNLVEAGLKKVAEGVTTLDEVLKHLGSLEKGYSDAVGEKKEEVQIQQKANTRQKPLILAVDDEPDLLKILVKYLKLGGYDVVEARNGKEAVELVMKEHPDLIVTDVMMPVMDGFEETKILRSRLETAVIPIIMLTAKQDKESELRGLDAGADDYLTKPFDRDKLLARIKLLLKKNP